MNKILYKILKYAIDKAKKSKMAQSVFTAPLDIGALPKMGEFIDSYGNNHFLLTGYRSIIKPGWENMVKNYYSKKDYSHIDYINSTANHGKTIANKIKTTVETFSLNIKDCTAVEIGCHSGSVSFALAELGAKCAIGTEFSGYKVAAVPNSDEKEQSLEKVNEDLTNLRNKVSSHFKNSDRVSFKDDDICNTSLTKESFDLVISNDVLEHLHNIDGAFKNIANILKKGGIAYHDYNPFFSINGGHSMCTLDFPWGHTRLNQKDILRYFNELRPLEEKPAKAFYIDGLNRASINQVLKSGEDAGLETLAMFKIIKEQHLGILSKDILLQSQNVYPDITAEDLVCQRIILIQRKK